jgi:hypothetical protein
MLFYSLLSPTRQLSQLMMLVTAMVVDLVPTEVQDVTVGKQNLSFYPCTF